MDSSSTSTLVAMPPKTGVVRFYTHPKDGVTYRPKVTPLLTRKECLKWRAFSNFYHNRDFSFTFDGVEWKDTETPFQYYRWIRNKLEPNETPAIADARREFAEHIKNAPTPSRCFFLQRFVKYRKTGGAYCSAQYPAFKSSADLIISAYKAGVRRPLMDETKDFNLMLMLNKAKFEQNPKLMQLLKSTGSKQLVEHTTRDRLWGDGGDGQGANLMGKVLMQVRDTN